MTHFSAIYAGGSVVFLSWRGELDDESLLLAAENVSRRVSASKSNVLVLHLEASVYAPKVRGALSSMLERAQACGVTTIRLVARDTFLRMAVSTICLSLHLRYELHSEIGKALGV